MQLASRHALDEGVGGPRALLELQETTLLAARAARGLFKRPRYIPETIAQMDSIGVGSLPIVVLTGFFTGAVMALQLSATLTEYGQIDRLGQLVSLSLVLELGLTQQEKADLVAFMRAL